MHQTQNVQCISRGTFAQPQNVIIRGYMIIAELEKQSMCLQFQDQIGSALFKLPDEQAVVSAGQDSTLFAKLLRLVIFDDTSQAHRC